MTSLVAHPPKPGCKVQVIGAGLPRTGTNSFCVALETLLNGPAYHVGVQTALSPSEKHATTWTSILRKRPYRSDVDYRNALSDMAHILDGYVVTADPPLSLLVPELMELYPDAKVICTVRDVDPWATSMEKIAKLVNPRAQSIIFFWVRNLRLLPAMWTEFTAIWKERYGRAATTKRDAIAAWERHHAWLEDIVPKDKLFYVDVRDGWGPLCEALGVPVPHEIPFPRLNDGKAMDDIFRQWAIQGIIRWFLVLLSSVMCAIAIWTLWYRT